MSAFVKEYRNYNLLAPTSSAEQINRRVAAFDRPWPYKQIRIGAQSCSANANILGIKYPSNVTIQWLRFNLSYATSRLRSLLPSLSASSGDRPDWRCMRKMGVLPSEATMGYLFL